MFYLLRLAEWTQEGHGRFDIWEDVLCETGLGKCFKTQVVIDERNQRPDTGQVCQGQGPVYCLLRGTQSQQKLFQPIENHQHFYCSISVMGQMCSEGNGVLYCKIRKSELQVL